MIEACVMLSAADLCAAETLLGAFAYSNTARVIFHVLNIIKVSSRSSAELCCSDGAKTGVYQPGDSSSAHFALAAAWFVCRPLRRFVALHPTNWNAVKSKYTRDKPRRRGAQCARAARQKNEGAPPQTCLIVAAPARADLYRR
jgi:hypothetical protein